MKLKGCEQMKWFILSIAILLFILILIFITKIKIHITYSHKQEDDHFHLKLRAWGGIIRYTMKVPVIKVAEDSASVVYKEEKGMSTPSNDSVKDLTVEEVLDKFENIKKLIKDVFGFHILVRKFLNKVKVKTFQWHSLIGTGDVVLTGTCVGGCYAIKGSIIGLISRYIKFKKIPIYSITPDYQKTIASTSFFCIVEFRIGHAIVAGIKIFRYWKDEKVKFSSEQVAKNSS